MIHISDLIDQCINSIQNQTPSLSESNTNYQNSVMLDDFTKSKLRVIPVFRNQISQLAWTTTTALVIFFLMSKRTAFTVEFNFEFIMFVRFHFYSCHLFFFFWLENQILYFINSMSNALNLFLFFLEKDIFMKLICCCYSNINVVTFCSFSW